MRTAVWMFSFLPYLLPLLVFLLPRRAARLLIVVPFLPLVVFLIPRSLQIMPEPGDPWYAPFTAPVWLATAMYVYPATLAARACGVIPGSPLCWGFWLGYAALLALITYALLRSAGKRRSRPLAFPICRTAEPNE
jgi:hypothetical protein